LAAEKTKTKNRGAGADDSGKENERARSDATSTLPRRRRRATTRAARRLSRPIAPCTRASSPFARIRPRRPRRRSRAGRARVARAAPRRARPRATSPSCPGSRSTPRRRGPRALSSWTPRPWGPSVSPRAYRRVASRRRERSEAWRASARKGGRDGRTEGGDVARAVFCDATGDARPLQRAREKTKRRPRVVSRRTIGSTALVVQDDGTNRNRRRRRSFVPRGARALSTAPRRAMHVLARALLWQLVLLAVMLRWRARKGARARVGTPAPATAPSSPPTSSRCVDRLERLNGARTALCALPLSPLRRINAQTDFCELGGGAGVSR